MRGAPLEGLQALAELRAAGLAPAEAVRGLVRIGGPVGAWASGLAGSVDAGVDLGLALARTHSLSPTELARIGGPAEAGGALALHAVAYDRALAAGRRRALLGALWLPGIMAALTALPVRAIGLFFGGGVPWGALLVDCLPFAILTGAIALWATPLAARLPGALRGVHARAAHLLGLGFAAGVSPPALFDGVARCSPGPAGAALSAVARRLREGSPLAEAIPPRIPPALALALVVGSGANDLPARLGRLAAREEAAAARAALRAVRIAAWIAVAWLSWRAFASLGQLQLGGLPGDLKLPGLSSDPAAKELMRELGL